MTAHGYQSGRLDLPFVGISSFGKSPICLDWDAIDVDVAVLGAPYYEILELLAGLAKRGSVVGIDLVEVASDYDHTGTTAILAAPLLLNSSAAFCINEQRSLNGGNAHA